MKTKNLDIRVEEFATLNYTIVMRRDDDGDVIASITELDGCVAHGQDAVEALAALESMKRLWIESCLDEGKQVPLPAIEDDDLPSGKWLQRVPRTLHRKLTDLARREGVSLNQYVVSVLAEAVGARTSVITVPDIGSIHAGASFSVAEFMYQSSEDLCSNPASLDDFISHANIQGILGTTSSKNPYTMLLPVKGDRSNAKKEGKELTYNC
jgi:predicted RNase H-like HicB family nuclease